MVITVIIPFISFLVSGHTNHFSSANVRWVERIRDHVTVKNLNLD